jgi:catalase
LTENFTTTQTGAPVASDEHSLTVGASGATVLHDAYLLEKLAQFNRERVPERIVHAKGGGAFGTFEVTGDVSRYTRVAAFQPGAKVATAARFSSVAGEMGSPDTWRDVRGFATRFYTPEGNLDIVGNNTPVFFIRDGIKFPDFIHSQKRLPGSGLRDADMQWDFWTLSPESAHQVTYLMGDRGLPRSWREMHGFSSHTYLWTNADAERFWVQYHFRTDQGEHNISNEEAEALAGADADHYRRDLYEAIARGDFPSWTLHVQIMPYEDAKTYRFNPFDLTKVWSQKDYPLVEVGRFTLDRNPENHFAEIEQIALSPANVVPGHAISPDKMLTARVFSYPDAQRYRVGTNYNELPTNRPHAPVNNYSQDGQLRHGFKSPEAPVYAPNSFGGPTADPARAAEGSWESDGALVRAATTLHPEDGDFGQAGTLYRDVFTPDAKERFHETLLGQAGGITREDIRERFFQYWTNVDANLGALLRERFAAGDAGSTDGAAEMAGLV